MLWSREILEKMGRIWFCPQKRSTFQLISSVQYLNWRLTIGKLTVIFNLDVVSVSSQNLFISLMSPGIRSFSSSAILCDLLPSSVVLACGVSLSRHTCFELNGVGSFELEMWKLKSEWWPPSLLSSLGWSFWIFREIASIVGSSIVILNWKNWTKKKNMLLLSIMVHQTVNIVIVNK